MDDAVRPPDGSELAGHLPMHGREALQRSCIDDAITGQGSEPTLNLSVHG